MAFVSSWVSQLRFPLLVLLSALMLPSASSSSSALSAEQHNGDGNSGEGSCASGAAGDGGDGGDSAVASESTGENRKKKTNICLNMIVKDETAVMGRLIESVKDAIDYYIIVDTGSTDGTQDFVGKAMAEHGISGQVHERKWVNFGVNRQQALDIAVEACGTDWILFIDADDVLVVDDPFFYLKLKPGTTYDIKIKRQDIIEYYRPCLVWLPDNVWRWEWPLHEALSHVSGSSQSENLEGAWIRVTYGEGARSLGVTPEEKYLYDAALLESYVKEHPDDTRSQFYLAQSYRDAGHADRALEEYRKRAEMSHGWVEETFCAKVEAGKLAVEVGESEDVVTAEFLSAFETMPSRGAEPLKELAAYYRNDLGRPVVAYVYASAGAAIATKQPDATLFVPSDVYAWRMLDEVCSSAYYAKQMSAGREACKEIIDRADSGAAFVPEEALNRIKENLEYY